MRSKNSRPITLATMLVLVAIAYATMYFALLATGNAPLPAASGHVATGQTSVSVQTVSHHTRTRTCNRPPRTGNGGEIVYHGPTRFFEDGTCRRDGDRMFSNRQVRQIIRVMCIRQGPSGPACRVLRSGRI